LRRAEHIKGNEKSLISTTQTKLIARKDCGGKDKFEDFFRAKGESRGDPRAARETEGFGRRGPSD